jgi:hypothetical protein
MSDMDEENFEIIKEFEQGKLEISVKAPKEKNCYKGS